ncbi:MAG: PKD domain-containing protein, partial [Maribacter sp.]
IPEADVHLGSIIKEYKLGETELIELNASELSAGVSTLILDHKNGNDLAFASKEHASKIGPKLVITYNVAEGTNQIIVPEEEVIEAEDETTEETDANQEPTAVADASPSSGGMPLEVSFSGGNSFDDKEIVSFNWDFKDGSTSTNPNPTHTYTEAGVYEAILSVIDSEGLTTSDIVTITVSETPNEGPNAVVSATPTTGEAPLEVSFTGSASTDDNSISSYVWDLKDGSNTSNADFKHTYNEPGTYVAELIVKDENGLTDKETITITVSEPTNDAPVARTSASTTAGTAPLAIQFTGSNSSDDKEVKSYSWDFKDGSIASAANPSHTFADAGTYVVELTVTDAEGLSHKNTITIRITQPAAENEAPIARTSASSTSGQAPLAVQFTGTNSSDDEGITSYYWDFKDGANSTNSNPSHTFTQAGTFVVGLTVTDADGESHTNTITINVSAPVSTNNPPGFYVATNGNSSNSGTSPSSPWSIEHAFNVADAGDVVYVKAGNYGYKQLLPRNAGRSGSPIKFIGYKNTPSDITSGQGSTFSFGQSVDPAKMPLLRSSNGQGKAITLRGSHIEIENFQITGYSHGIETISIATNVKLKNIIITKVGSQSNSSSYTGIGIVVEGNNTLIENCFVLNAGAEGIKLFNSDYSRINNCKVYATNNGNPTDYYYLITGGTNNTVVENSYAERANNLGHNGHGFTMKDLAEYNTFRNCTVRRTTLELNFSGVKNNTIENCKIYGVDTSPGNPDAVLAIGNGANNNLIKNTVIQDTWTAIRLFDLDDGYVGPGGDRDLIDLGYNNIFDNVTVKNTNRMLNIGGGTNYSASARNYTFKNCSLDDFEHVAVTYYRSENFLFQNCSFNNGNKLVVEFGGQYAPYSKFNVNWSNNSWSNVNFNPPN